MHIYIHAKVCVGDSRFGSTLVAKSQNSAAFLFNPFSTAFLPVRIDAISFFCFCRKSKDLCFVAQFCIAKILLRGELGLSAVNWGGARCWGGPLPHFPDCTGMVQGHLGPHLDCTGMAQKHSRDIWEPIWTALVWPRDMSGTFGTPFGLHGYGPETFGTPFGLHWFGPETFGTPFGLHWYGPETFGIPVGLHWYGPEAFGTPFGLHWYGPGTFRRHL